MYTPRQTIEIFHLLFLRHLEEKLDKNFYALKGGCNLRFFFKSIRYSEGIDFDIRTIAKETLCHKMNKLLTSVGLIQSLKSKGIEIANISEAKQTETTQRWKLMLKVAQVSLPLPTKIEFSRRNMNDTFLFEPVDPALIHLYQLYPVLTNHYRVDEAFKQKVNALIFRTETQARDIFDLQLLMNSGVKINHVKDMTQENLERAIENAMSIDFSAFKGQVVAYLMNDYQEYYDNAKVWEKLKMEVIHILERLKS